MVCPITYGDRNKANCPHSTLITAHVCVRIIAYNCRTQRRTEHFLIIFPLILQTIIIAQMMSTGGEGPRGVCYRQVREDTKQFWTHSEPQMGMKGSGQWCKLVQNV